MEDGMRQERAGPTQLRWKRMSGTFHVDREHRGVVPATLTRRSGEHVHQRDEIGRLERFVQCDRKARLVHVAQVDVHAFRFGPQRCHRRVADLEPQGVEVTRVRLTVAELSGHAFEHRRHCVHTRSDRFQAGGTVVHGIHRRHVREQRLRRADVRRGLLSPDVLLARLQGHPVSRLAVRVDRDADDAARCLPHVRFPRGKECGVRAAIPHRHAESLRVADDDVGAHFAGRREERQRQEIRRNSHEHARGVRALDGPAQIGHRSGFIRILQEETVVIGGELRVLGVHDFDLQSQRLGARTEHRQRLGKHGGRHQERIGFRRLLPLHPVQHRHGLGRGRGFVEEGCVRDLHRREIAHHRLEIEKRLEAPLRDLGLVRGVGRVPAWILHHVSKDDRRRDGVVVPEADEGAEHAVLCRDAAQPRQILMLGFGRRQVEGLFEADGVGDDLVNELVE